MFQKLLDKVNKVNNLAQKIEHRKKQKQKKNNNCEGSYGPVVHVVLDVFFTFFQVWCD